MSWSTSSVIQFFKKPFSIHWLVEIAIGLVLLLFLLKDFFKVPIHSSHMVLILYHLRCLENTQNEELFVPMNTTSVWKRTFLVVLEF